MKPATLLDLRDRVLGDRRFQRWAARFWLTRPIVRRQTRTLFDLCAGFVYAQVLSACVRLDAFALVAERPRTAGDLAVLWHMTPDAAACLLDGAVALRLLSDRGGCYGLGMLGAAMRGNPGIAAMIAHHDMLYADLADPVALLRTPAAPTRLGAYWAYAGNSAPLSLTGGQIEHYTALMAASQPMIADEVLAACDFRRHRRLLDIGGGDGGFLTAVAAAAPGLRLMLFDLPPVAAAAATRFAAADLAVQCHGGDFRTTALPDGADIISLVRVLHDHDDATVRHLLARTHAALPPGGRVLIAEPMADDPAAAAYFAFYLRAMGSGRPRRAAELIAMLQDAGFTRPRRMPTPTALLASVITARRA